MSCRDKARDDVSVVAWLLLKDLPCGNHRGRNHPIIATGSRNIGMPEHVEKLWRYYA